MFRLSKGAEYAVRSVLYLSLQPKGKVCYSEEISRDQEIPPSYLAKIFQSLAKKGIVRSTRGVNGGISLLKAPESISMYDVIAAIEGDIFLNDCLIYEGFCPRDPVCPAHVFWKALQKDFLGKLESENFENLAKNARILRASKPKQRRRCRKTK